MNKKRIWLAIPTLLLPYIAILMFTLPLIFVNIGMSSEAFYEIFPFYVGFFAALFVIAIALIITCAVLAITKRWDSLSLAKTAMIIKLIQIPAYIIIYILGLLYTVALSVFGLIAIIIFVFVDYLILISTGILNISAIIAAIREGKTSFKSCIWIIILQFIFCCDIVASIIFYTKIQKASL